MAYETLSEALQSIEPDSVAKVRGSLIGKLRAVNSPDKLAEINGILGKYPSLGLLIAESIRVMEEDIGLPKEEAIKRASAGVIVLALLAEHAEIEAMPTL